jgi:hypothetical protein
VTFRIDLDRGKWCEGQCEVIRDIASVTDKVITLHDGPIPRYRVSSIWTTTINRHSREHLEERFVTGTVVVSGTVRRGECREGPFEEFPDSGR